MDVKIHHRVTWHRRRKLPGSHSSHAGAGGLFICISCRKVHAFKSEALEAFEEQVAWQHGFALRTCKLLVYGLCQGCQASKGEGAETG